MLLTLKNKSKLVSGRIRREIRNTTESGESDNRIYSEVNMLEIKKIIKKEVRTMKTEIISEIDNCHGPNQEDR